LRDHRGNGLSHGMVRSQDVYAEDAFEVFITGVVEPSHMGDARAVDQDVYAGELQNILEYGSCAFCICEIAEVRGRDSARLIDSIRRLLCCLFVQVYDPNDSTMLCEAESNCLADAAGPAGYKRYFIFQTKSAHSVAPLCSVKKIKRAASTFYWARASCVNNKHISFTI
jgi:hypothetical protein